MIKFDIKEVWKFIPVLIGLLLFIGGFAAGRFSHPGKKTEEAMHVKNSRLEIEVKALKSEIQLLNTQKNKTTLTKFSPTTGKKTSQKIVESTKSKAATNSTVSITSTESTRSASLLEKTLITESQPNWSVSLLGGVSSPLSNLSMKPVAGVHVERRILGPFKVGGWLLGGPSVVSGGASIGGQF